MDNGALYRPRRKTEWRILRSEDTGYQTYYAFPTLLQEGEEALIAVKTGHKHWGDSEASLSLARVDVKNQALRDVQVIFAQKGLTPQQGEIVKMPNGDVCVYIDMQKNESSQRTGMWELRSFDGGRTFPMSRAVGMIDGMAYGYPLSMAEKNGRVYMLAMTFDYLPGGRFREVHVISSDDSGATWRFEVNLRPLIGVPFNESCILPCQEGFLLMTRGERDRSVAGSAYDGEFASAQYIAVLDDHFHLLRKRDFRHTTAFFSLTGRPRLYWLEGSLCLFTRQHVEGENGQRLMTLDMFRIDPKSLDILARVRLDEARFPGQDGHYPVAYTANGQLHVVTYLSCCLDKAEGREMKCDLTQLSFDLAEILALGRDAT